MKPSGTFIIDECHPFRRIWKKSIPSMSVQFPYFNRGPFEFYLDTDVLEHNEGSFASVEFHWTISDFINAVIQAGCQIIKVDEYGTSVEDWEEIPAYGLPENLLIIAKKQA